MKFRKLVIDASIARSSGDMGAVHPTATITRDFLQAVLYLCHSAVMTPAIREEWDKHQSNFARKWRRAMVARKRLISLSPAERDDLRQKVNEEDISNAQKKAMIKDFHLIEAAIVSDRQIFALDDTARSLFCDASQNIPEIKNILWVNPSSDSINTMDWLKGGATQVQWELGYSV